MVFPVFDYRSRAIFASPVPPSTGPATGVGTGSKPSSGPGAKIPVKPSGMGIALFQPEIPHNTGTLMRLGACLNVGVDIIHPCGFLWEDRHLRRAGMDYQDKALVKHHTSWENFFALATAQSCRLVLLDTKAETSYLDFTYSADDIVLLGQESSGVPEYVYNAIPNHLKIPMVPFCRSLNLSLAAAMVVGEALRQLDLFPKGEG